MHPRQMKLKPHQRISAADFRAAGHALALVPKDPVAPACAFHATLDDASGWAVQVARDFSVTFVASGLSLSFAKGTGIVLCYVENWTGNDRMAIAIDKVWGSTDYHLVAMRDADLNDKLRGFTVGGFDLDPSGAILAGSFWDAHLADDDCGASEATNPVARRIADIFVERARDGFADTTGIDLVREGISERDAMLHYEAGAALAAEDLHDTELSADRVTYDRQQRVMLGANAVAGLLLRDTGSVHTACRQAGLQSVEVGNLFDDIIGEAMKLVRAARPALVAVQ